MSKRKYLIRRIILFPVIFIIITAAVIGAIWIFNINNVFKIEIEKIESDFINRSKETMRSEVDRIIDYISRKSSQKENVLKESIKLRTYEAYYIAMNIYEANKNNFSEEEIKKIILDALRPIRYNNGRGYFFIVSLDGYELLYPVYPEFENQYVYDLQDEMGNYIIRKEIELVQNSGEGYVTDYWKKPDEIDETVFPKISFVKLFEPYDWYIGTGEYIDDVEKDIQIEVLDEINNRKYGTDRELHLFCTSYEGIELANGKHKDIIGTSIKDLEDKDGINVFQQEMNSVIDFPEGNFIYHSWFDSENPELDSNTMVYVVAVEEWEWIVGTSMYMDEISKIVEDISNELRHETTIQIILVLIITVVIIFITLFGLKKITDQTEKTINTFNHFFEDAVKNHNPIDVDNIDYQEFKELAKSANRMIRERKIVHDEIKKLSVTDGLTKLANHNSIFEMIRNEIKMTSLNLSIIILDLDDFKKINDEYGHLEGDEVLKQVSRLLEDNIRKYDVAGRYGGEEFLVMLPGSDESRAYEVAERIRKSIEANKFKIDTKITVSIGVSQYKRGESIKKFIGRADENMYRAKKAGKNKTEKSL